MDQLPKGKPSSLAFGKFPSYPQSSNSQAQILLFYKTSVPWIKHIKHLLNKWAITPLWWKATHSFASMSLGPTLTMCSVLIEAAFFSQLQLLLLLLPLADLHPAVKQKWRIDEAAQRKLKSPAQPQASRMKAREVQQKPSHPSPPKTPASFILTLQAGEAAGRV